MAEPLIPADPTHPYNQPSHPDHRAAVAEVARRFEAAYPADRSSASEVAPSPATPAKDAGDNSVTANVTVPPERQAAYWDPKHPQHADAVLKVRDFYERANQEAEPREPMPIDELRRYTGFEKPYIPPDAAPHWSTDLEGEFLQIVEREGVSSLNATAAGQWYVERALYGDPNADDEADFREWATNRMSEREIEALVRWGKEKLT